MRANPPGGKQTSSRLADRIDAVIVGSVALDTIETPAERREAVLGGSATYACCAACVFCRVGMVAAVGSDFPAQYTALYRTMGIDTTGLAVCEGRTFRWMGAYEADMQTRRTICTELNVFGSFSPELPEPYRMAPFLLLGNIAPELQLHVLLQMRSPRFVAADTMNLWISSTPEELARVMARVNVLMLNDEEARMLAGERNLRKCAARILEMGPQYVVIKKGEHGALLATREGLFWIPPYPVDATRDPTGAGDAFAGGFIGALAQSRTLDIRAIYEALLHGSVMGSFAVEDFSVDRLARVDAPLARTRLAELRKMVLYG